MNGNGEVPSADHENAPAILPEFDETVEQRWKESVREGIGDQPVDLPFDAVVSDLDTNHPGMKHPKGS